MISGSNLESILTSGQFAVTGELGPPKSGNRDIVRKKARILKGYVDAVNITDCQTAIVRMSSLTAGLLALSEGVEPVMQMTCRDRNRIGMQADILGAHALGVKNLLCLTGDHQKFGNHPQAKGVFDMDSIQLLQMVKAMRDERRFQCGEEIKGGEPRLFLGAAANPFADPFEYRPIRLKKKVDAGANFVQTQIIYNVEKFKEFMKRCVDLGITERCYILAGVTPPKSLGMARYMKNFVPGLDVTDEVIGRLKDAKDVREEGINIAVDIINEVREIPGVAGVHVMAIEWEEAVPEIVKRANLLPRPEAKIEPVLMGAQSIDEAVEQARKEAEERLQGEIRRYKEEVEASKRQAEKEKEEIAREINALKREMASKEDELSEKERRIQELLDALRAEKAKIVELESKGVVSTVSTVAGEVSEETKVLEEDIVSRKQLDFALRSMEAGLEALKKVLGLEDEAFEALKRFIEAEFVLKGEGPAVPTGPVTPPTEKRPPAPPEKVAQPVEAAGEEPEVHKRAKEVVNLVAKGNLLLHQGKAAEALTEFKKALEIDPEDEKAKAGLEEAQKAISAREAEEQKEEPRAEETKEGIPPTPEGLTDEEWQRKWVIRLIATGNCALYEKDQDKAISCFEQALRLDPENEKAKRGLEAAKKGEFPTYESPREEVVEEAPKKEEAEERPVAEAAPPEEKVEEVKEAAPPQKEEVKEAKPEEEARPAPAPKAAAAIEVSGEFEFKKEETSLLDRIGSIPQDLFMEKATGSIREVVIGDGDKAITVGGASALPFHLFEGDMPHAPKIAYDVLDSKPEEMPEPLLKYYEECLDDPVKWAKKCETEFNAQAICLSLVSTDPNGLDRSSSEAAKLAKEVIDAVECPVILWGCGNAEKDTETLREITAMVTDKKVCIGPLTDANYRNLGATAMAMGLPVVASTPIDVNLAKQLNILLENLGLGLDHILMDPSIGAVGYGLEYTYSVMERIRLAALMQQDEKLQAPFICNVGREVWKAKEVKLPTDEMLGDQEVRSILLEAITAASLLFAGGELVIMRHPRAVALTNALIQGLMG